MRKYPRLLLLCGTFVLAYLLYQYGYFTFLERINGYGYASVFVAGLLFSFGFTSPFAIAAFVQIAPVVHPLPAAMLGGVGAFLMDLFIFEIMRFSTFHDELYQLRQTWFFRRIHRFLHHEGLSERIRIYLLWSLAGFVIASPLPDEIGVSLVSGITKIEARKFGILCFLFNAAGIFLMLTAARLAA